MKKRILSLLFALVLLQSFALPASADHPVPKLDNGSLTFILNLDKQLLDGGQMNLYKVGEIRENDGDYSFRLIDALQGTDLTLDDLSDPALSEDLLVLAKALKLPKIVAPISQGRAAFTDLLPGLYLVWQGDSDATEGFSPILPFLISIPKFQNGQYVLDVIAKPKVPLETQPPETSVPPTTKPLGDKLPQTGQLNWPVPVMAVAGGALFLLGLCLCVGRKRFDDEI